MLDYDRTFEGLNNMIRYIRHVVDLLAVDSGFPRGGPAAVGRGGLLVARNFAEDCKGKKKKDTM